MTRSPLVEPQIVSAFCLRTSTSPGKSPLMRRASVWCFALVARESVRDVWGQLPGSAVPWRARWPVRVVVRGGPDLTRPAIPTPAKLADPNSHGRRTQTSPQPDPDDEQSRTSPQWAGHSELRPKPTCPVRRRRRPSSSTIPPASGACAACPSEGHARPSCTLRGHLNDFQLSGVTRNGLYAGLSLEPGARIELATS